MDVDKYAPFTSSPLDSSRGRGRRLMMPRLRTPSIRSYPKAEPTTTTVVVIVSQALPAEQTTTPQVGGSIHAK
jgi:hypothetical protein